MLNIGNTDKKKHFEHATTKERLTCAAVAGSPMTFPIVAARPRLTPINPSAFPNLAVVCLAKQAIEPMHNPEAAKYADACKYQNQT